MIYIIEGTDGAGKTTLIEALKADKRRQCHFLSSSSQPKSRDEILAELAWIQTAPPGMNLFLDRCRLISEPIYGRILRGYSLIDSFSPFPRANVTFIYCRPPTQHIVNNLKAHPQLEGVHEYINELIATYDNAFEWYRDNGYKVLKYDYTIMSEPFFINNLFVSMA